MRRIIQANIDRFRDLLKTETDATKRTMEKCLLAEEESKLLQLIACGKKATASSSSPSRSSSRETPKGL